MDIEELLYEISIHEPNSWDNNISKYIGHWYAVSNCNGIIAYFADEKDACMFRLDYINTILNG